MIKIFINLHSINYSIDITNEKAGKEAVMAVYAIQNSESNYPELVIELNKARTLSLAPKEGDARNLIRRQALPSGD